MSDNNEIRPQGELLVYQGQGLNKNELSTEATIRKYRIVQNRG